jgi:DnaK suppressor protein
VTSSKKQFRDRLNAEKAQTDEELAGVEKRLENKGDYTLGEGDPSIYEWEMNLARRRELRAKQSELNQALERLQSGQYTVCSICGEEIEEARLELLPTTTVCSRCARGGRTDRSPRKGAPS